MAITSALVVNLKILQDSSNYNMLIVSSLIASISGCFFALSYYLNIDHIFGMVLRFPVIVLCTFIIVMMMGPLNMVAAFFGANPTKDEILEELAESSMKKDDDLPEEVVREKKPPPSSSSSASKRSSKSVKKSAEKLQ